MLILLSLLLLFLWLCFCLLFNLMLSLLHSLLCFFLALSVAHFLCAHVVCSVNLILFTFIIGPSNPIVLSCDDHCTNRFYLILWHLSRSSELWVVRCREFELLLPLCIQIHKHLLTLSLYLSVCMTNDKINVRTCDITMFEYCFRL